MNIYGILETSPHPPPSLTRDTWNATRYGEVIRAIIRHLHTNKFGRIVLHELIRVAKPDAKIKIDPDDGHFNLGNSSPECWQGFGDAGVTINFVPAPWRDPHSVLVHELFHAIGYMTYDQYDRRKAWEYEPLPGIFKKKGEILAMALANLYRLEEGHELLRVGYLKDTRWVTPETASFEFSAHLDVFQTFVRLYPAVGRQLGVAVPRRYAQHLFNPFRWVRRPADIAHQRSGALERQQLDDIMAPPA